jgi:hypothetical protein
MINTEEKIPVLNVLWWFSWCQYLKQTDHTAKMPWVPSHLQFAKPSVSYILLCKHSDHSLKWLLAAQNASILQSLIKISSCPLPAYHTSIHVTLNLSALSCNGGHCDCNWFIPLFNSKYSVHKCIYPQFLFTTHCIHVQDFIWQSN